MGLPYIYERIITSGSMSGSVERGVRLQNATMVRQFGTSDWTKIRAAIRYRIEPTSSYVSGSGLSGTPRFMMGFCNGNTNVPGDEIINQFMGVTWNTTTTSPVGNYWYIYNGSTTNINIASASLKRTSEIDVSSDFNTYYACRNTASCDALFVDIEKIGGGLGFKVGLFLRNSSTFNAREYYAADAFISDMQSASPTHTGYVYSMLSTVSQLSASIATYPLNAVCLYWERTDPIFEIIDLYIIRLT